MNHITDDYTCHGVILLKFLQIIQQNCTDNSHLCLNYKRYFIHLQCYYCPDSKLTDTETQFENRGTFTNHTKTYNPHSYAVTKQTTVIK